MTTHFDEVVLQAKEEWKALLKDIPRNKDITIINESPTLVQDSIDGRRVWEKILS